MKELIAFFVAALLIMSTAIAAQAQKQDPGSALLEAAAAGQIDVVKALLDIGANVETKNNLEATSLILASAKGHAQVVELLVSRGANVNVKTTSGITPLMAAAVAGDAGIVKMLLEKGADVSAKDDNDRTARDLAQAAGETQVVALLGSVQTPPGFARAQVAPPTPAPAGQSHTEIIRGADGAGGLTVRTEPSPNGPIMAYLPVGSRVTYSGEAQNGWVRLTDPTPDGWVAERYLGSRNLEASVTAVDNPEQCLRVRSGPGTQHEKVGCLPKGATVKLTGTAQSGWAQIAAPMAGWVTARQIQAPGLFPQTPATSGKQRVRRSSSERTSYRRQQADAGEPDSENVEEQSYEDIGQFRRETGNSQVIQPGVHPGLRLGVQPGSLPGGALRVGPFGVQFRR